VQDAQARDARGRTPLWAAVAAGHTAPGGTAELLLRRCPLYGDAGVPMLEVCVTTLTLYSDEKVANRDIRVRHGGAAAAPLSVVRL
jgi:hypothetical protein